MRQIMEKNHKICVFWISLAGDAAPSWLQKKTAVVQNIMKSPKNASLHLQPVFFSWILSQQVVCLCRRVVLKSGWIHEWGFVNCNFHPSQRFEFPTVWQPSYWRKHHAWPALPHRSLFDSQENYRRQNGCKDLLFCDAYFIPVEYFQETFITKLL